MLDDAPVSAELEPVMTAPVLRRIRLAAIAAGHLALFSTVALAQSSSPPPIPGSTGSIVPDGKGDGATDAIGAATGKVIDGARHVLHPGSKDESGKETDPLSLLALGTKVVVRQGDATRALPQEDPARADAKTTEGTVIELDRRTRVIVLRLADRTTERLRLDESSAPAKNPDAAATKDTEEKVTLSYTDTNGGKARHVFKKVP
jgi:hypothetical protein